VTGTEGEPARRRARIQAHLDDLTKPVGALGRLEELALRLAMVLGDPPPPLEDALVLVMAADHGVAAEGVSAYPAEVTRQMCLNMAAGGAAVNVLARSVGARVEVVDVGVRGTEPVGPGVHHRRVREGTRNLAREAALRPEEVEAALQVGRDAVWELGMGRVGGDGGAGSGGGAPLPPGDLVLGEMGIGNTTAASALASVLTGAPPEAVVGPGTGVSGEARARKVAAVEAGVARVQGPRPLRHPDHVRGALAEVVALAGAALACREARVPVVVDGFIASVAALAALRLDPALEPWLFAAHRSAEPGHDAVLRALGLDPLLDLGMRLGEGTGGVLALPLLRAAGAILREMATFQGAGVSR
jgi:nicotinate-nucleotide--dimethylbenzimidazole phosphoribosyltransferase